jgi:cell wall-associated NlpC family hydrolase
VTDGNQKSAARGLLVGALVSASIATAVSWAGVADATCTPGLGNDAGAQCAAEETSFSVQLDEKSSVSAQGRLGGPGTSTSKRDIAAGVPATAESRPAPRNASTQYPANDHVLVAESMVGTDMFGPYGCEDFVDAAFGLTTDTGIGHDMALSFYQSLAARGLDHHETPIPRGALVFSKGPYGNHVDIARGDGTFVSGGVQGLSPGYGDGHQVQILPSANLGAWTMYGWVYPPW